MIRFAYLIASFLLYIFAPEDYSLPFCIACALIFILHFCKVFTLERSLTKTGILSFNILFSLSAFAVVFVFPLLIYQSSIEYSFRALSIFSEPAVNKVTALSTFGYSFYLISYEYYFTSSLRQRCFTRVGIRVSESSLLKTKILAIVSVFAFTANLLFFMRTVDSSHNDLSVNTYIAELTKCFLTICLLCCCEKYKENIKNSPSAFFRYALVPIACFFVVMLEYLYIGDRGFIIVGGLMLLFSYNHYVRKVRPIILIPAAAAAIVVMSLIGQLRKTDSSLREGGLSLFVSASREIVGSSDNTLDYLSDLTAVSNVAYLEWDYSNSHSLYKPERLIILLSNPLPVVPTLLSLIMYNDNVSSTSTGYAVTEYYKSQIMYAGDGGLGTHLIMDLYMSWSIIGVIIGMWLLGLFLGKANALNNDNIYYMLLLITFFGLVIYLPRSTVYACFRTVVWEILFIYLLAKVDKVRVRR